MNHSPVPDVLVIGGGIAGVSTAFHLAHLGRRVTLLERGEIAGEASGVNAGGLGGTGWGNIPDLQAYLTMGSLEIFKSLQLDLGHDIELRVSGALQAVHNEQQWDHVRERTVTLRSQGHNVELLTTRASRAIEPEISGSLAGFLYMPHRGRANPLKATRAFAAAAANLGADIRTGHDVTSLDPAPDGTWTVKTSDSEFKAGSLVLAAGAWSRPLGRMLGLEIPVEPVRGQMWATEPVPPSMFHLISSNESYHDWTNEPANPDYPPELTHHGDRRVTRHLYGSQVRTGEIIFGGDRQLAGYDYVPNSQGIEVNRGHAAEVIPLVGRLPISGTWAGIMPFSMDGAPIIGKIPQMENLFIVTGLASSGFGRGPMAGRLLADYVHTGHRPHLLGESDPARCVTVV